MNKPVFSSCIKTARTSKSDIAVRNRNHHNATGNHIPYTITFTQCYLSRGSSDFPAFP